MYRAYGTVHCRDDGADEPGVCFEVVAVIETATDETERLFPHWVREF